MYTETTTEVVGPPRGEAHVNAKLTEEQVRAIRKAHADGFGYTRLARMFGISKACAARVCLRRTWAHVA